MLDRLYNWCWAQKQARKEQVVAWSLDRLPNDLIVDLIFVHLDVEDVVAMRQVSRLYYALSHHSIVWKRFLPSMTEPLPPVPPTARHNWTNLTALEAEKLICQTISLGDNWRSIKPKLYCARNIRTWWDVQHLALTAGGHYMVASLGARDNDNYSIMIYGMNRPNNLAEPLARMKSVNRPYCLSIKYLPIGGVQGVLISFMTRRFVNPHSPRNYGIDLDSMTTDYNIDVAGQIVWEVSAYHISLEQLEKSELQDIYDHPFQQVAYLGSKTRMTSLVIEEMGGETYVLAILGTDGILIKNLTTGAKWTLKCHDWAAHVDREHIIRAFRVVPEQNQILVIREVRGIPDALYPLYAFEMYDIPSHGKEYKHAVSRSTIDDCHVTEFSISTRRPMHVPGDDQNDDSVQPFLSSYINQEPPPIAIYMRTTKPDGMLHVNIWPRPVHETAIMHEFDGLVPVPGGGRVNVRDGLPRHYYYPLSSLSYQTIYDFTNDCPGFGMAKVVPGAKRSLVLNFSAENISDTPSINGVWCYDSPEVRNPDNLTQLWAEDEDEYSWEVMHRKMLVDLRGAPRKKSLERLPIPTEVANALAKGLQAVAFDETTGRMVICGFDDQQIFIIDYSHVPTLDLDGQRMPLPYEIVKGFMAPPPTRDDPFPEQEAMDLEPAYCRRRAPSPTPVPVYVPMEL